MRDATQPLLWTPADMTSLRSDLTAAGYTVDLLAQLLGPVAASALHRDQAVPARRALAAVTQHLPPQSWPPAATLASLFILGDGVPAAAVDAALPATGCVGALKMGLVTQLPAVRAQAADASSPASPSLGADDAGSAQVAGSPQDTGSVEDAGPQDDASPQDDATAPFPDGQGTWVTACVALDPYDAHDAGGEVHWWLAADLGEMARGGGAVRDNHVLGVGGATMTLAQITVRDYQALGQGSIGQTGIEQDSTGHSVVGHSTGQGWQPRVADIGTGCGLQALQAARHSRGPVVATDISARALTFAQFNADLNAVAVDVRAGSMLEPLAGAEFDLLVSNPPFVISPQEGSAGARAKEALGSYDYRDAGRSGDNLVRELMEKAGSVLAPGGIAQFLANWEHRGREDWQERVGRWADVAWERYGLDVWVIQRGVHDPAQYAETWIRDGGTSQEVNPQAWAQAYEAWLDDFASRDVQRIGFGIVTLRKPLTHRAGRQRMRRLEEHSGSIRQPLGKHIGRCLAGHDWQANLTDEQLRQAVLVTEADVTEERYLTPGWDHPNVILLRQGDGLGRAIHASTELAALVGACTGELTVGQIIDAIASLYSAAAAEPAVAAEQAADSGEHEAGLAEQEAAPTASMHTVDPVALSQQLLPAVRSLVVDGFLSPALG